LDSAGHGHLFSGKEMWPTKSFLSYVVYPAHIIIIPSKHSSRQSEEKRDRPQGFSFFTSTRYAFSTSPIDM